MCPWPQVPHTRILEGQAIGSSRREVDGLPVSSHPKQCPKAKMSHPATLSLVFTVCPEVAAFHSLDCWFYPPAWPPGEVSPEGHQAHHIEAGEGDAYLTWHPGADKDSNPLSPSHGLGLRVWGTASAACPFPAQRGWCWFLPVSFKVPKA